MKFIKKFNEMNSQEAYNKIEIDDSDLRLFSDEPSLQKLVRDNKVSIIGNEVQYDSEETLEILKQYI